jgi:hypothetical protein
MAKSKFELAMMALETAIAVVDAANRAKAAYAALAEAAKRDHELTQLESDTLDAKADAIFSSPASQPSGLD